MDFLSLLELTTTFSSHWSASAGQRGRQGGEAQSLGKIAEDGDFPLCQERGLAVVAEPDLGLGSGSGAEVAGCPRHKLPGLQDPPRAWGLTLLLKKKEPYLYLRITQRNHLQDAFCFQSTAFHKKQCPPLIHALAHRCMLGAAQDTRRPRVPCCSVLVVVFGVLLVLLARL